LINDRQNGTLSAMATNDEPHQSHREPMEDAEFERRVAEVVEARLAEATTQISHRASRRGLLRLAGAAAAGGAGAVLATSGQAAASTGPMMFGAINEALASSTYLASSSAAPTLAVWNNNVTGGTALSGVAFASGTGVYGGVSAASSQGYGVWGDVASAEGYGVVASGGQAQIWLEPALVGPSTATQHRRGELAFDERTNALWLCVADGQPGTWREVGGVDSSGAFHAIPTARVYDSRLAAPGPQAPLASGQNRVVACIDKRDPISGAVTLAGAIPAEATAVAFNLTLIATAGGGFLSVEPWSAASFGGSTANWGSAGQVVANASVAKLDGSRQLKVFCGGGGSADFVIDIVGYYL
jgi:hypothetical protein